MTIEEYRERHRELHKSLDELAADYITQTRKSLDSTSVMDLIEWSFQQTIYPTERK